MKFRPVSYAVTGEATSPKWAAAFAAGCGGTATHDLSRLQPGPMAAFGTPPTWPLFDEAQAKRKDWYYGDHGLFRRGVYYRVVKNGYQPSGLGTANETRFRALHVDTQPAWNTGGSAIVICPNSPVYMARHGIPNAMDWCLDLCKRIGQISDRPIVLRWKKNAQDRPLYVDLHAAWMVVVFSSGAAVEALAGGVPVCTLAPWASTAHMGITSIEDVERPYYPSLEERDQFLFNMANQQWSYEEIRRGMAWKALQGAAA